MSDQDQARQSAAGAADGRGALRVSHEDRDQVAEVLRVAAGDGRLTADELDERLERALTARTYDDLAALVTDLPAAGTRRSPLHRALLPGPLARPSWRAVSRRRRQRTSSRSRSAAVKASGSAGGLYPPGWTSR